jgi:hypothetical protein
MAGRRRAQIKILARAHNGRRCAETNGAVVDILYPGRQRDRSIIGMSAGGRPVSVWVAGAAVGRWVSLGWIAAVRAGDCPPAAVLG